MNGPFARLFVDVSYTRTQPGSIGITRTVRCLADEFMRRAEHESWSCLPVAVHSSGYRALALHHWRSGPESSAHSGARSSAVQWVTGSAWVRRLAARVPMPLLKLAWRSYTRTAFDLMSRSLAPVQFRAGDVLFLPDAGWHYASWRAVERARKQGAKVVLMVHDLIPVRQPHLSAPLVLDVFTTWLAQMLRRADAIVCNSQATLAELQDYARSCHMTLPPAGSFRLGADLPGSSSTSSATAIGQALVEFLQAGKLPFAAIGSFEPRKNYTWLMDVFERLWAAGHDVRLLIMGRPTPEGGPLIDSLLEHPEHGRRLLVVLNGSDDDLAAIYEHARAVLLPSLAEGFGLPLVEARTRGCPVIASDLPAFHELADAGVSLYPVNSVEDLQALVLSHADVDRRGLVGAMPAFTWKDSAEQLFQTFTMLLDRAPRPEGRARTGVGQGADSPVS